jgi:hypothetical protein
VQRVLEELDRVAGPADGRVRAAERAVDVAGFENRHRAADDRRLEVPDRAFVVAAAMGGVAERCPRARRDRCVARCRRLREQLLELELCILRVLAQAKLELGVAEPQLAFLGRAELGAGLEVVDRDLELLGEHAEGLDRGRARASLDARDVGVRDALVGERPLREAALDPKSSQTLSNRLDRPRHEPIVRDFEGSVKGR